MEEDENFVEKYLSANDYKEESSKPGNLYFTLKNAEETSEKENMKMYHQYSPLKFKPQARNQTRDQEYHQQTSSHLSPNKKQNPLHHHERQDDDLDIDMHINKQAVYRKKPSGGGIGNNSNRFLIPNNTANSGLNQPSENEREYSGVYDQAKRFNPKQIPAQSKTNSRIKTLEEYNDASNTPNNNSRTLNLNTVNTNNEDDLNANTNHPSQSKHQNPKFYLEANNYDHDQDNDNTDRTSANLEEKYRAEYNKKLQIKVLEIEERSKRDFETAMKEVTEELEKKLIEERDQLEKDLERKWNEKYESLESECKASMRDEKEKKLFSNMYNKLKASVEAKIYENEYPKVEARIRAEVESKLELEIKKKKMMEIDVEKRKLESFTKKKLQEIEENVREKCKETYDQMLRNEVESKEKELKVEYMKKYHAYKTNVENQLKAEYERKREELEKELRDLRDSAYRKKTSVKLRQANVSKVKDELLSKEKKISQNNEKIDRALTMNQPMKKNGPFDTTLINQTVNQEADESNISLYKKPNKAGILHGVEKTTKQHQRGKSKESQDMNPSVNRSGMNKSNVNNVNDLSKFVNVNSNDDLIKENEDEDYFNTNAGNTTTDKGFVNLMELNKTMKKFGGVRNEQVEPEVAPRNLRIETPTDYLKPDIYTREVHNATISPESSSQKNNTIHPKHKPVSNTANPTMNNTNQTTVSNTNNKLLPDEYQNDLPQKLNTANSNPNPSFYQVNTKERSISLQLSSNIPSNFYEFTNFLETHIENEENYKVLFEKEFKKLREKLKSIFSKANANDHCLIDYLVELWDKLEISYVKRYKIFSAWSEYDAKDLYQSLDKETEALTDYFKLTDSLYKSVKNREKLKAKLQQTYSMKKKPNNEELELLKLITNEVEKKIKELSTKGISLVWKGISYEWLVNYENKFYEGKR